MPVADVEALVCHLLDVEQLHRLWEEEMQCHQRHMSQVYDFWRCLDSLSPHSLTFTQMVAAKKTKTEYQFHISKNKEIKAHIAANSVVADVEMQQVCLVGCELCECVAAERPDAAVGHHKLPVCRCVCVFMS